MTSFDPTTPGDLQLFFESWTRTSPNVVCLVAPDETIAFINPASRHILGYEPKEMTGRPFVDFLVPGHRRAAARAFAETRGGEPHFRKRVRASRKDGREVDLSIHASAVLDAEGVLRGVAAIAM